MPKRDRQHEEEQPKESTLKYEGGQGSKTREQQQANRVTQAGGTDDGEQTGPKHDREVRHAGGARLEEDREQHDEAERNSEANRHDRRGRADEHDDSRDRGPGH